MTERDAATAREAAVRALAQTLTRYWAKRYGADDVAADPRNPENIKGASDLLAALDANPEAKAALARYLGAEWIALANWPASLPSPEAIEPDPRPANERPDIDGPECWSCGQPCGHVYATPIDRPATRAVEPLREALERIFSAFDKSGNVPMFLAATISDVRIETAAALSAASGEPDR